MADCSSCGAVCLKNLLTFLNFGTDIICLIMSLNSFLVGMIIMNNTFSDEFEIKKGVVQGKVALCQP